MADYNLSSNMNMPIPTVGVDAGPDYALNINSSLTILDGHTHASGSGVQITPAALNINAELPINNNNLTLVKSVRFQSQLAALSDPTDIGCLYESGVDLYFNDGAGNQIRITQSGSVTGSSGTITGLPSGTASAAYLSVQGAFQFQSATNTPADIDSASIIIRNKTSGGKGVTLNAASALAANYSLTLPQTPASQKIVTLDSSGIMAAVYDVDNSTLTISSNLIKVADSGIGTTQLANGSVTAEKLAVGAAFAAGMIMIYGGTSAPSGWLLCDGTSYLRTDYANLFTAIGTAFGTADGTHFNVPDFRGRFLRGVDGSTGRDPDAASRTAMNTGGNTGDNVGSIQSDQYKSHTHTVAAGNGTPGIGGDILTSNGIPGTTKTTNSSGGNETRPINAYVTYIIKT